MVASESESFKYQSSLFFTNKSPMPLFLLLVILEFLEKSLSTIFPFFFSLIVFEFLEIDFSQSFHIYSGLPNYNFYFLLKFIFCFLSLFTRHRSTYMWIFFSRYSTVNIFSFSNSLIIAIAFYVITLVLLFKFLLVLPNHCSHLSKILFVSFSSI